MKIVYRKTSSLIPYEKNPRINEDSVEYVVNSIREFGYLQPIVIDKNNVVVAGHTRLKASKRLKLKEVPCVIASDLSEEQIKAYRLADNKCAEFSKWDIDLLNLELEDIPKIDMEQFGFEFRDEDLFHAEQQQEVQHRVSNILNLEFGQYEGDGPYDIPKLKPVKKLPKIKEWIGFNEVLSDKEPEGKAVHFFIDDYQFERIWNEPEKYVEKLAQYVCVATPDFSPYADMPLATQIWNMYRKNWVGAYLQSKGITVIPTIRASKDERSLDFYLDGVPQDGIVIISSMWTSNEDDLDYFINEYETMFNQINPRKVFVYGKEIDGLDGKIEYIKTFGMKRWNKDGKGK